jgi:lipopolysaccharide export system permease protein
MPANINPQLPIDTPQRRIDSASAPRVPNDSVNVFAPATPRPAIPTPNVRAQSTLIPSQPYLMTAALEGARSRMVESQRMANQNAVELHKKFAISVACFVFVLVGAPIALRFPRAGVGLVIGVSLAVFAVYYVGLIGGEALADRGFLPPALAMWSTNLLLTIIGLALLSRIGAEGATARGGDMGEMLELVRNWFGRFRRTKGATPPPPASPATPSPEPST